MPAEQIANIIGRKQACRAGIQHRHVSAKIKDFCWCVYPRLYISKMCRVAVLQKTGNTSWEVLKYRYAAPGWVWGRARTRTREKANAFPLIRAYAEIPLRGMLHHNICFGHYFNTLTDFCTWPMKCRRYKHKKRVAGKATLFLCARRDSNPHVARHQILSLARLPITPRAPLWNKHKANLS